MKQLFPRVFKRVKNRLSQDARRLGLRTTIWTSTPYQPVGDLRRPSRERPEAAFEVRWNAIAEAVQATGSKNLIEIGCAEGYFVRRASRDLGLFALGIEGNWSRVGVGMALAELTDDRKYGFAFGIFAPSEIQALPKFDVVVCFSVVHHVINRSGRDGGLEFLRALAGITGKRFLFDMGGPDETSHAWASKLEFLKGDVDERIRELLEQAGFSDIQVVGKTPGHRDAATRSIFSCASAA